MSKNEGQSPAPGLFTAFRFCLAMSLLCGLAYPMLTTHTARLLFPWQAGGSLIEAEGRILGSQLIGQPFLGQGYFHGRPSAAAYDPMVTGGSNLAPDNPELRRRVAAESIRVQRLEAVDAAAIPVDRLAASASGLDPHLSPQSALMQVPRVAKARGLSEAALTALVEKHLEGPQWGLFGQPRVNVLLLNLAVDKLQPVTATVGHMHESGIFSEPGFDDFLYPVMDR